MNAFELTNPVDVTKRVFGLAGTAVGLTGVVAREAVHAPVGVAKGAVHVAGAAAGLAGTVVRETAHALRTPGTAEGPGAVGEATVVPPGPTVVRPEPRAPEEPPVDVVGEALAAEAAADHGNVLGGAHEPRGASRAEEHGEAALQRAEADELADEVSAALEDRD